MAPDRAAPANSRIRRLLRPWDLHHSHLASPLPQREPGVGPHELSQPRRQHPRAAAASAVAAPGGAASSFAEPARQQQQPCGQLHAESVLPAMGPYGPVPVYGRSVESILAAVAAERGGEGLKALFLREGSGRASDGEDALDVAFNQLPHWGERGDTHAFDWSGATNYTARHLQARGAVVTRSGQAGC